MYGLKQPLSGTSQSLVLPRVAGFSMGQACPALRGILYLIKVVSSATYDFVNIDIEGIFCSIVVVGAE
ncbi:MAG: hypothetical protein C0611_05355 [Desulfobacteraceae bacterium]|nr:MAG: hypothetical protein C0611_05355 [Desulfobacteraceae bacterium]